MLMKIKESAFKSEAGTGKGNLIEELFKKCLFFLPTAQNHGPYAPPKCKTPQSRASALKVTFLFLVNFT